MIETEFMRTRISMKYSCRGHCSTMTMEEPSPTAPSWVSISTAILYVMLFMATTPLLIRFRCSLCSSRIAVRFDATCFTFNTRNPVKRTRRIKRQILMKMSFSLLQLTYWYFIEMRYSVGGALTHSHSDNVNFSIRHDSIEMKRFSFLLVGPCAVVVDWPWPLFV